jgi:hypothetical protein
MISVSSSALPVMRGVRPVRHQPPYLFAAYSTVWSV